MIKEEEPQLLTFRGRGIKLEPPKKFRRDIRDRANKEHIRGYIRLASRDEGIFDFVVQHEDKQKAEEIFDQIKKEVTNNLRNDNSLTNSMKNPPQNLKMCSLPSAFTNQYSQRRDQLEKRIGLQETQLVHQPHRRTF
jgi:hypothetical protein